MGNPGSLEWQRRSTIDRRVRAFTLIELLIVVAIIGILAAIAVPNFLNAQIRAKLARVKSDLRNIVVAADLYRLDEGTYPPNFFLNASRPRFFFHMLTTPIPYLTGTSMPDPFATHEEQWWKRQYYTYVFDTERSPDVSVELAPYKAVALRCNGPDKVPHSNFRLVLLDAWGGNSTKALTRALGPMGALVYMPSNGIISRGDIGRTVGDAPPGLPTQIGG